MKKFYSVVQEFFSTKLLKIAGKASENKPLKAISTGMIMTLPITVAASLFMIIASFPVPAFTTWLTEIGLTDQMKAISNATINILGLFVAFTIAYSLGKLLKVNEGMAGIFSLAAFLTLMPQTVGEGDAVVKAFSSDYLGSGGLFVAIIIAITIPYIYSALYKSKKFVLKLPDSVPSNVSSSFEPLFIGMIIFILVFIVRVLVSLTSYGNLFDLINTVISAPLMEIGGSIPAMFVIFGLSNILFFFGIHPNPIYNITKPIYLNMVIAASEAIEKNQNVNMFENIVVYDFAYADATGSTLALLIAIFIIGKSYRYKTVAKLGIIPNVFQINEPVIFGLPIMLNPVMFIPFFLSSGISQLIAFIATKVNILVAANYNPAVAVGMPWTMPKIIQRGLIYGWGGVAVTLVTIVVMVFVWMPFIKILDKQEYTLENAK